MEKNSGNEGLKRELGIIDIGVSVVNMTVGSGIFLLPALVAAILGNASIIAYLLCGLLYFCIMLCYAELSSRINHSGGTYVYIERAFGPFAGFIANNLFWLCGALISAALVNGIADMLSVPLPVFNKLFFRILLFCLLIGFIGLSNIRGIKQGMRVVKLLTFLKLLPLVLLAIIGLFHLNWQNLTWTSLPSAGQLGTASLLLFAAFIGGESAATLGREMKNRRRTGPRGILLGVFSVILFYILIHLVAQSILGDTLAAQKAPLATLAGSFAGNFGLQALIFCGIVSMLGCLYSMQMTFARVLFAGSFNGLFPSYLSKVHPKYATPHWSITTLCLMSLLMACSGGYRQLIIVATISMMLLFVGAVSALIRLKLKRDSASFTGFKLPGGIFIPTAAAIALCWFLFHSKKEEVFAVSVFIGVLTVIYLVRYFYTKRAPVVEVKPLVSDK